MNMRQRRRLQRQIETVAAQAPQVMAHRACNGWQALGTGDAAVWSDWWGMGTEKLLALHEAGWAMTFRSLQAQQAWWQQAWSWPMQPNPPAAALQAMEAGWLAVANSGMTPVRKRVQRNLRRLRNQAHG